MPDRKWHSCPMVGTEPRLPSTTAAQGPELISARRVSKAYGSVEVLADVTFDIQPGITGLLGSNGAGKTTMLGMILGLHPIDGGTLAVYGHNPWSAGTDIRGVMGYAPEHHTLPADLRANDFVRHVAELHGLPRSEATTRASDALWLVGLGEERFRPMGTMSTGQRQRVKLAQAIAHDPSMILLDEPTDGLDPVQRDSMLDLIRGIADDFKINVIVSSHLLHEVERICDGVVIIDRGRTLASGTIDAVRGNDEIAVIVEIDSSAVQAVAVVDSLMRAGWTASSSGRRITIGGDDDSVFDAARDHCVAVGVGINRLQRRRLSLEDVFLEKLG